MFSWKRFKPALSEHTQSDLKGHPQPPHPLQTSPSLGAPFYDPNKPHSPLPPLLKISEESSERTTPVPPSPEQIPGGQPDEHTGTPNWRRKHIRALSSQGALFGSSRRKNDDRSQGPRLTRASKTITRPRAQSMDGPTPTSTPPTGSWPSVSGLVTAQASPQASFHASPQAPPLAPPQTPQQAPPSHDAQLATRASDDTDTLQRAEFAALWARLNDDSPQFKAQAPRKQPEIARLAKRFVKPAVEKPSRDQILQPFHFTAYGVPYNGAGPTASLPKIQQSSNVQSTTAGILVPERPPRGKRAGLGTLFASNGPLTKAGTDERRAAPPLAPQPRPPPPTPPYPHQDLGDLHFGERQGEANQRSNLSMHPTRGDLPLSSEPASIRRNRVVHPSVVVLQPSPRTGGEAPRIHERRTDEEAPSHKEGQKEFLSIPRHSLIRKKSAEIVQTEAQQHELLRSRLREPSQGPRGHSEEARSQNTTGEVDPAPSCATPLGWHQRPEPIYPSISSAPRLSTHLRGLPPPPRKKGPEISVSRPSTESSKASGGASRQGHNVSDGVEPQDVSSEGMAQPVPASEGTTPSQVKDSTENKSAKVSVAKDPEIIPVAKRLEQELLLLAEEVRRREKQWREKQEREQARIREAQIRQAEALQAAESERASPSSMKRDDDSGAADRGSRASRNKHKHSSTTAGARGSGPTVSFVLPGEESAKGQSEGDPDASLPTVSTKASTRTLVEVGTDPPSMVGYSPLRPAEPASQAPSTPPKTINEAQVQTSELGVVAPPPLRAAEVHVGEQTTKQHLAPPIDEKSAPSASHWGGPKQLISAELIKLVELILPNLGGSLIQHLQGHRDDSPPDQGAQDEGNGSDSIHRHMLLRALLSVKSLRGRCARQGAQGSTRCHLPLARRQSIPTKAMTLQD